MVEIMDLRDAHDIDLLREGLASVEGLHVDGPALSGTCILVECVFGEPQTLDGEPEFVECTRCRRIAFARSDDPALTERTHRPPVGT